MITEPLIEVSAHLWWLALFVASLAGSAWCLATAFDDWQGDWRGVWHRSPKYDIGVQHGEYRPFDAAESVVASSASRFDREAPGW